MTEHETDRSEIPRPSPHPADPRALTHRLSGTVGPVLDPVFVLRKFVQIAPGGTATLAFTTGVFSTREAAVAFAGRVQLTVRGGASLRSGLERTVRVELRHLGITATESHTYQRLAGHVLFPPPALRALASIRENRQGQPGLWPLGISGDLPILVACVSDGDGMPLRA